MLSREERKPQDNKSNQKKMLDIIELLSKQQVSLLHPFYVSVPCFLFLTYFLVKWITSFRASHKNLPPSPQKLPIIGNLHQMGHYPHRSLSLLSQQYGPLMLLHFGSLRVLIVSSAEAAREVMKTNDLIFSNRPELSTVNKLLYNRKDVSAAPYGEYWRQMRSVCVLHLLSNKRVLSFRAVREEETALLLKKIRQFSSSSSPVNLSEMLASLTNDVVCRAAFGKKYTDGEGAKKFKRLLGEFMTLLGDFNVGAFVPWLNWINRVNGFEARVDKIAKEFDEFLEGVVEEHVNSLERKGNFDGSNLLREDPKGFVDVLLELQRDAAEFSIDRDNVKGLILDMFAGGTDTSYTVLEWAMSELLRHPRIMKKLQTEVRGIANAKTEITEADLDKMQYLKLVIKETLRLHPPLPLLSPRESTQDVKIMGYHIPAGTTVFTNFWAIGRDPKYWNKPEEFWPERFLNNSVEFRGQDFQLIPFGTGRRGCPGLLFAMTIDELVLSNLVKNFDWSLPHGVKGEDLDMTEALGFTTHRKHPLVAIPTPSSY